MLQHISRIFGLVVGTTRLLIEAALALGVNAATAGLVAAAATVIGWRSGPAPAALMLAIASILALSLWARSLLQGRMLVVQPGVVAGALLYSGRHLPVVLVALLPLAWWSLVPLVAARVRAMTLGSLPVRRRVRSGEGSPPPLPPARPPDAGHPRTERPLPSERYRVTSPRFRWSTIVGMRAFLAELDRTGRRIVGAGATDGENGILLHGEPGNGKTHFAHALADRLGIPILEANLGQVKSMWINETAIQVTELFAAARAQAPCLLFLDEASSLLQRRDALSGQHAEDSKATDAFLQELGRIRGSGVVIVAAANDVESLDPAAIRPGRFDQRLLVPAPDAEARDGLIRSVLEHQGLSIAADELAQVSPFWEGFSVSMVREVTRKAARRTQEAGRRTVDAAGLEAALREQQGGESELRAGVPALDTLVQTPEVGRALRDLQVTLTAYRTAVLHGVALERGAVFCGPPGTGKTLGAQALASALGWNFVQTTGAALLGPGAVKALFARASRLRPCIVLVDEADTAMDQGATGHAAAVVRELRQVLDGASAAAHGAFVIACTNHPERLDPALIRPGRLERRVEFRAADVETTRRFIAWWVRERRVELHFLPELDSLAGRTFAELEGLLNRAYLRAANRHPASRPDFLAIQRSDFELAG